MVKTCEEYVLTELEKYINLYEERCDELVDKQNELTNTQVEYEVLLERYNKLKSVISDVISFHDRYIMLDSLFDSSYNEKEHFKYEFMKELFYDDWASKQSTEDEETDE